MSVDDTIKDRDTRYGGFENVSNTTVDLKETMRRSKNWDLLPNFMRESLDMIVHKIARILNGDPNYKDNWHDIQGYAKLSEDQIKPVEKPKKKTKFNIL